MELKQSRHPALKLHSFAEHHVMASSDAPFLMRAFVGNEQGKLLRPVVMLSQVNKS